MDWTTHQARTPIGFALRKVQKVAYKLLQQNLIPIQALGIMFAKIQCMLRLIVSLIRIRTKSMPKPTKMKNNIISEDEAKDGKKKVNM